MPKKQSPHPRNFYADFKPPPNERVRVEMFLGAYEDYQSLEHTFPLPELPAAYGGPICDQFHWIVVMHAALLRKFFADREQTELHAVIRAVRSKIVKADELVDANLAEVEKYAKATNVPSRFADGDDGGSAAAWERVLIDLYGRHLHSDFGKWHASNRFLHRSNTIPIYEWCRAAAGVLETLVLVIRNGEATGVINLKDDMEPYFKDDGGLNRTPQ